MRSKFWGRAISVHAHVLLPRDYAEHPDVRFPVAFTLGHGDTPLLFSTTPATQRRTEYRQPRNGLESGYATYQAWSGNAFPRVIALTLEQQTPYFPHSYSVTQRTTARTATQLCKKSFRGSRNSFA
jgi:hypothetical protein